MSIEIEDPNTGKKLRVGVDSSTGIEKAYDEDGKLVRTRIETERRAIDDYDIGMARVEEDTRELTAWTVRDRREQFGIRASQEVMGIVNIMMVGRAPEAYIGGGDTDDFDIDKAKRANFGNTSELSKSDEDALKIQSEAYRESRDAVESLVWDAYLSLSDEHIFTEVVDKMAYIEGQPANSEAQLRGLFFEAISHRLPPGDSRALTVYEGRDTDTSQGVDTHLRMIKSMPIEEFKVVTEDGKKANLEKGVILGEMVRNDLRELVRDERLKDVVTLVNADQIRDSKTPLPDNAIYMYLPKLDKDNGSQLRGICERKGIPFFAYDAKKGWQLNLSPQWHARFTDEAEKVKRAKDLLSLEFFIRAKNEKHNQEITTPDGILLNEDGVPNGIVETKCWYPDEVDEAIRRVEATPGMTPADVLQRSRSEMTLDEVIAERAKTNRDERRAALPDATAENIGKMNLAIKLAEELEYMRLAGINIKDSLVLLRFPADITPGQAEELKEALAFKDIHVLIQILPVSADQVGSMATNILKSEIMVKMLEQRYKKKTKEGDRLGRMRALKARCLALGQRYDVVMKWTDSPDKDDPMITKLWQDVGDFNKKR
jgi:hypothetical protein